MSKRRPSVGKIGVKRFKIEELPSECFWRETVKPIFQDVFENSPELEGEYHRKTIELYQQFSLASTYYRNTFFVNAPDIDHSKIPTLLKNGFSLSAQKKLIKLRWKSQITGLDEHESDILMSFWSAKYPNEGEALAITRKKAPINQDQPPQEAVTEMKVEPVEVKVEKVKKEKTKEGKSTISFPAFDLLKLEQEESVLVGRFSFLKPFLTDPAHHTKLNKRSLEEFIETLMTLIAYVVGYRLHFRKIHSKDPRWGRALWDHISKEYQIWVRAERKYKLLCFWAVLDKTALKKALGSKKVKDLDLTDDRQGSSAVKELKDLFVNYLTDRKNKAKITKAKSIEFFGLKTIFSKCFKDQVLKHI